jgi:TonB family protein
MSRGWWYGGAAALAVLAVAGGFASGAFRAFGRAMSHPVLPAIAMKELPFEYPVQPWRDGIEGETLLRVHINDAGAVDSVRIEESSGHAGLDSAAVAAAFKLRYHPAREGDVAIAVWALLPIRFRKPPDTAGAEPTP